MGRCGKPRSLRFSKLRWTRSLRPWERRRPQPPVVVPAPVEQGTDMWAMELGVTRPGTRPDPREGPRGRETEAVRVVWPVIGRHQPARDGSHESGLGAALFRRGLSRSFIGIYAIECPALVRFGGGQ